MKECAMEAQHMYTTDPCYKAAVDRGQEYMREHVWVPKVSMPWWDPAIAAVDQTHG